LAELAEVLAEFSAAGSAVVLAEGSAVVLAEGLAAVLAADLAADLETFGLQDGWLTLSVETPFAGWLWSSWRLLPRNVGIR
jgi:hypothetical protein